MRSESEGVYAKNGKRKYLTRTEGREFLRCAAHLEERRRIFCEVVYYTGCRVSEALGLTRTALDASEPVLHILCLKKRGKTVIRRIPIPPRLAKELRQLAPPNDVDRMWPYCRTTGWQIIKNVMIAAGISGIQGTAKGLRHGFGVRSVLVKVPVSVIQGWMGHAHVETTAIYLAVKDDEERELMRRTWDLS